MNADADMDVSQYLNVFLEETKEHVQTFTQALIDLEGATAERVAEVLNEAFRAAHTIKGMSASMGFGNMEHLCHSTEDVMDQLRSGSRTVTPEIIDLLLESATKLEELTCSIEESGNDTIDISTVLNELDSLTRPDQGTGKSEVRKNKRGKQKKRKEETKKIEITKDKSSTCEQRTYEITISLDTSCGFKGARGFLALKNLSEVGDIIKTVPSQEDIEDEHFDFDFKVFLAAETDVDGVKKALSSVADIVNVAVRETQEKAEVDKAVDAAEKGALNPEGANGTERGVEKGRAKEKEVVAKSVRISIDKLDTVVNLVGELVINKSRLIQIGREHEIDDLSSTMAVVERTISDLQYEVTQMRMIPVEHVFNRFPKLVRDLYRVQGKDMEFVIQGMEIELDRTVLDEIIDPIVHLLRNSVDHGIELPDERERKGKSRKGLIKLVAKRETGHVAIRVEDDGKGMDPDKLREKAVSKGLISVEDAAKISDEDTFKLIFMPGFSTAERTTEISGRGVGMEVVKTKIEALGGFVDIQSKKEIGTKIMLKLPLTTAIIQALLVNVGGKTYAVPLSNVKEIIRVSKEDIKTIQGTKVITLRGPILPLVMLKSLFGLALDAYRSNGTQDNKSIVVVVERSEGLVGLVVDAALEQQEIVVKPPDEHLQGTMGLGGFTILGDGNVIPILDVATVALM